MHRVLSELKMLDKRINSYLPLHQHFLAEDEGMVFIGAAREVDEKIGTQTRAEYTSSLQSNWQKINALISNKRSLEAAKVASNAKTVVEISGKSYSVADAIKRKEDIHYEKDLLNALERQHREVVNRITEENALAEQQASKHVEALFGAAAKGEQRPAEEIEQQRENFMEKHRWAAIDPIGSDACIERLRSEIADFEAEVDAVLSESNATTLVTVEFED